MSGEGAHFSFLVHSPNVMKECASPPLLGMGRDPLQTRRFRCRLEGGDDQGLGCAAGNGSRCGCVIKLRWIVDGGSKALRVGAVWLWVRALATVIFRTFRLCLRSENAVDNART